MRTEDELRRFHEAASSAWRTTEEPAPDHEREEDAPDEDAVREAQRRLGDEPDDAG